MKHIASLLLLVSLPWYSKSQDIQLHYDLRHTTYPELSPNDYPALAFEYLKNLDSSRGSFLAKVQVDLNGTNGNVGQIFLQLSQTLRFWKPKLQLALTFSGGLGATPNSFGYYINNSYGIGAAYPFQFKGAFFTTQLVLRYNTFNKPSYDPQFTFYVGRGYFNYRVFVSASFTFWTQNNDIGTDATQGLRGKDFKFFGDPQIWFKVYKGFSIGTRVFVFYHTINNDVQFFPTLGTKYRF